MGVEQMIMKTQHSRFTPSKAAGLPGSQTAALEAALADMTETFSSHLTIGRVGDPHDAHEHRSHVLRQMAGELATMRKHDAATAT